MSEIKRLEKLFNEEMKKFEEKLDGKTKFYQGAGMDDESELDVTRREFERFKVLILSMLEELKIKSDTMEEKIDDQENYSRRTCLLVHGIKEETNEKTDEIVLKLCENNLKVPLALEQVERTHRLGKPATGKTRPIIVKFSNYRIRQTVFGNKKLLKGQKITITESLSNMRLELFKATKSYFDKACWTRDGVVFVKLGTTKRAIRNYADLEIAKGKLEAEENRTKLRPRTNKQ